MTKQYGVDDYVDAMVSAAIFRKAAPPLRNWHAGLFGSLERALVPNAPLDETGARALTSLLETVVALAAAVRTPFSGIYEFPRDAYQVVEPHAQPLEDLATRTRSELRALARTILVHLHPGLERRTVTSEDLMKLGFDDSDEPDPDDYF